MSTPQVVTMRVGQGFDIHTFSTDRHRPLVIGGVTIAGSPGLAGHSDADVLAHALADALLGAAGLGDLGDHFPDDDPAWAGADSTQLLAKVVDRVAEAGFGPVNADCTVIAEQPRLAPHLPAMRRRLSEILSSPVNVKATTSEGIGPIGNAEAIAALAVVLVRQRRSDGGSSRTSSRAEVQPGSAIPSESAR